MNTKFPLASTAALIADPARAAMLTALLDGRALSAGELARTADVSAQSASMHLAQLLEGGFLKVAQQGRHRYFRLAKAEVADAIEALGGISTVQPYRHSTPNRELCYARTCYDHLAGELAVRLHSTLEHKGLIVAHGEREYDVTRQGEAWFREWQIDVAALRGARRTFARRCLDWTERRYHLAGAVGAAICQKFLEFRWIARDPGSRAVRVSPSGQRVLQEFLTAPGGSVSPAPSS